MTAPALSRQGVVEDVRGGSIDGGTRFSDGEMLTSSGSHSDVGGLKE